MTDMTTERHIVTEDGATVHVGDTVCCYYDGKWGVIARIDSMGWADVVCSACDRKIGLANGQRLAVKLPRSNPFYLDPIEPFCKSCSDSINDHLDSGGSY